MKKIIITGITGQDGSYLAEYLLNKKYIIHGIVRQSSTMMLRTRIDHLKKNKNFFLHYGDITDFNVINGLITKIKPSMIFNLAAQSHVKISSQIPIYTSNVNAIGCLNILESIKNIDKKIKFYQASTSELYGNVSEKNLNEKTFFKPVSIYAISKLFSYEVTRYYRDAFNIFAVNGILFNHESYRRGNNFVTKKIIEGAVRIKFNLKHIIELGNINTKRDWGYAPEYVEGMYKMMMLKKADDYVLATNESHSVEDFINETFKQLKIKIKWYKNKKSYYVKRTDTNKIIIKSNKYFNRDIDVYHLKGNYNKAKKAFNWQPKVKFKNLISIMLKEELSNFKNSYNK